MVPPHVDTVQFPSPHSGNTDTIQATTAHLGWERPAADRRINQQGAFHTQEVGRQPLVSNGAHLLSHKNE